MVQGLAFLSKKSWHTKNLNNQEKVWIAEQQQEQERIKTSELAKQIQSEREQNEINDITGNNKSKLYDRGIDWMYTGHAKDSELAKEDAQKAAEEYLLGKPIAFHGVTNNLGTALVDSTNDGAATGIDAVVITRKSNNEASETAVNVEEDDRKVAHQAVGYNKSHKYEDPMYAISLQAVRKEKLIEQQMELYNKVGIKTSLKRKSDDDVNSDSDRKGNKEADKKQKSRKRSLSNDSYSDYSDDSRRKRKKKDHKKKRHHKKASRKEGRSRDRYISTESSRRRNRHGDKSELDYHDGRRKQTSRSRGSRKYDSDYESSDTNSYMSYDHDPSRNSQRRDQHGNHSKRKYLNSDEAHESRSYVPEKVTLGRSENYDGHAHDHHEKSQATIKQCYDERKSGYGLQSNNKSYSEVNTRDSSTNRDIGPDRDLMEQKRNEKMMKYKNDQYSRRDQGRPRTIEERAMAIQEMENNAKSYDTLRQQKKTSETSNDANDQTIPTHNDNGTKVNFLNDISQQVHGVYSNTLKARKY